ncbi:MAG: protein kinase [Gemmatimonadales bacterium]
MLPRDWLELAPLVDQLLDTPPDERPALLAQLSAGSSARQLELAGLVEECERSMPLLERPAVERFDQLAVEEPALPLPDLLGGRYKIVRELGRGGMARVYLADDLKHARSVAVKVVRPELAESLGRDRFLREIGIAARLRHPNIMPLYDSGDADGLLYFVMPYEEGLSLRARLDRGEVFTIADAVSALRDVARALAHAHEQGIVHRDVKPDNVMLSGGAAVVTDFGIAKAFSAAQGDSSGGPITQTGVIIGTPAYMAPEQAVGDPSTDHRADIYAFGCLAYELFVGKQQFAGLTTWQIIAAQVGTKPAPVTDARPDVPGVVSRLIERCLEKDPAARPQRAQELLEVLDAVPASGARAWRLHVPRKWWLGLAAVVVATAAGLVLVRSVRAKAAAGRRLVVLPMENEAGDSLDYVATGLAEDVAKRLEGIGGLTVRSGARSEWPAATRHDLNAIGREFGSTILLKTRLARVGDSLELHAVVANLATKSDQEITTSRFTTTDLRRVASRLAATIAGSVFKAPDPAMPQGSAPEINPESYRLTLEGMHTMLALRNRNAARALFEEAIRKDPHNARALSGLSSTWAAQTVTDQVPFEDGYAKAVAAARQAIEIDSMQGSALANLGAMQSMKYRNLPIGLEWIDRAKAADPSNPEVFLVQAALYRDAWLYDKAVDAARFARELDPLTPTFRYREADFELCAGHPDVALRVYDALLATAPTDTSVLQGRARALARLGRYDDAISTLRQVPVPEHSPRADALNGAHGGSGYWEARHLEGRDRLAMLEEREKRGTWVSRLSVMQALFASGDFTRGFAALEVLVRDKVPALWRLRCMQGLDEVHGDPRFEQAVSQVGGLALK